MSNSSPQHRGQLFWTGAVAVFLALVALQQASDPGSSATARGSAEALGTPAMLGGSPLDGSLNLGSEPPPSELPEAWRAPAEAGGRLDPAGTSSPSPAPPAGAP